MEPPKTYTFELTGPEVAGIYIALRHWSTKFKSNKQMSKEAIEAKVEKINNFAEQFYIEENHGS